MALIYKLTGLVLPNPEAKRILKNGMFSIFSLLPTPGLYFFTRTFFITLPSLRKSLIYLYSSYWAMPLVVKLGLVS